MAGLGEGLGRGCDESITPRVYKRAAPRVVQHRLFTIKSQRNISKMAIASLALLRSVSHFPMRLTFKTACLVGPLSISSLSSLPSLSARDHISSPISPDMEKISCISFRFASGVPSTSTPRAAFRPTLEPAVSAMGRSKGHASFASFLEP